MNIFICKVSSKNRFLLYPKKYLICSVFDRYDDCKLHFQKEKKSFQQLDFFYIMEEKTFSIMTCLLGSIQYDQMKKGSTQIFLFM